MPLKIYVASSWRNEHQPRIVKLLREAGHEVYDFRNPEPGNEGFHWSECGVDLEGWPDLTTDKIRDLLGSKRATDGFCDDFAAMIEADVFVGVMPFGISASLEMGWAAGNGVDTVLYLSDGQPELMVHMLGYLVTTDEELLSDLNSIEKNKDLFEEVTRPTCGECSHYKPSMDPTEGVCLPSDERVKASDTDCLRDILPDNTTKTSSDTVIELR